MFSNLLPEQGKWGTFHAVGKYSDCDEKKIKYPET